jgi:hypothetical protein
MRSMLSRYRSGDVPPSGFKLLGCHIDHHNELQVPTIVQGLSNKGTEVTEVTEVVLVTEISGTE